MSDKELLDDIVVVLGAHVFMDHDDEAMAKWARVYGVALCKEVALLRDKVSEFIYEENGNRHLAADEGGRDG